MNKRTKISHLFVQVVAFILVLVALVVTLTMIWPSNAVSFGDWEVQNEGTVKDVLRLNIDFCNEGVNTHTHRYMDLYDGDRRLGSFQLPDVFGYKGTLDEPSECFTDVPQEIIIPRYVEDGEYRFRVITEWKVNGLSERSVEAVTEQFVLDRSGCLVSLTRNMDAEPVDPDCLP